MENASPVTLREISKRRTFAIISHPDAGKTTITEKLLLFGNAIQMAGVVKAKKSGKFATSDWMEIEKQRGISVTSSVMQFEYEGRAINLLDTPGHQDFSEDTYRVLTAVDSALMVIDAAKGIETQTKKLFQVCRDRKIPIMTFINKMDREAKDPFDLIDEIEKVLGLQCTVATWPIGMGDRFKGVYSLLTNSIRLFEPGQKKTDFEQVKIQNVNDQRLQKIIGDNFHSKLIEDLDLLSAGSPFDENKYLSGDLSPVFFGSAVNNFGVQELLESFVKISPPPRPRQADIREVYPTEEKFTGVIFKIQANMDPKHRDRTAFLRICSGKFTQGMTTWHVRLNRDYKINNAMQFLSKERHNVDEAFAGDIIGINDRGNLMIGDTLTEGENLKFTGVPQFSPEYFSLVTLKNPIKMKQLQKGVEQLAEEGASQVFRRKFNSDLILGVVGQLQFEVVKFRLLNEYGAEAIFTSLPFECSRWYHCEDPVKLEKFAQYYHDQIVFDVRGYPLILFKSDWEQSYVQEKNPDFMFYSSLFTYELAIS